MADCFLRKSGLAGKLRCGHQQVCDCRSHLPGALLRSNHAAADLMCEGKMPSLRSREHSIGEVEMIGRRRSDSDGERLRELGDGANACEPCQDGTRRACCIGHSEAVGRGVRSSPIAPLGRLPCSNVELASATL